MENEITLESAKGVLQDLVVVASLVHQLTDSFGSAVDLYRRLKRKPKTTESEDESEEYYRRFRRRRESDLDHGSRWHRRAHRSASRSRRNEDDSDEEIILKSSIVVQAEYDRGYERFGEKFARGDLITQVQLQSQIIHVQQTLLDIYRDLTLSTYLSPSSQQTHIIRLVQTVRISCSTATESLVLQSKRMRAPTPDEPEGSPHIPGGFPPSHGHSPHVPVPLPVIGRRKSKRRHRLRSNSSSSSSSDSDSDKKKTTPGRKPPHKHQPIPNKLFCVYAHDLQLDHDQPLSDNYKAGGNNRCPFCKTHIPIRPGKAWELIKQDEKVKGIERTFQIGNRFIVKCHREGGGFACALCVKYRDADTVSGEVRGLIEHMWNDHTCMEIDGDDDIEQMVKTWT